MFLPLAHTKLDLFEISRSFVTSCYKETKEFPREERYGMVSQIRRAALSVHLNIAEGCSRSSFVERRRFYEIARGSLIEVDTAFDIAIRLEYTSLKKLNEVNILMNRCFQMLSKMIKT
jgi:four helix bundle protein